MPSNLPSTLFVSSPPSDANGPDDLALLANSGMDGGKKMLWTACRNKINPNGTPAGPNASTLAVYDLSSGALVNTINVRGKVDGFAADSQTRALLATANEDVNSTFNLINPASGKANL